MKTATTLGFAGLAVLLIAGCSSLPEATYVTADGCGIAQWNKNWIAEKVGGMSWTGPCKSGLAHGNGTHAVKLKNGKERRYVGMMEKGYIQGDGTYTTEDGWKYEGRFLWAKLLSGKVYIANGQLLFDGLMAHNEKYNGKNITLDDQRYHQGKLYYADGSYIDDGRFDGSAGIYTGISTIDPKTGKGIIYGKYVKDGQTVTRYVEGRQYDDDRSYMQARLRYYEELNARLAAENAAAQKVVNERRARENREALASLNAGLNAAAGGNTKDERLRLATAAMSESLSGGASGSVAHSLTSVGISKKPDPRCAFYKLKFDAGDDVTLHQVLEMYPIRLRSYPMSKLRKELESDRAHYKSWSVGETESSRAKKVLWDRRIKERQDTLDCVQENHEFMLGDGEKLVQLLAFPNEWMNRGLRLPGSLQTWGDGKKRRPLAANEDYPWRACEQAELGVDGGWYGPLVLQRGYDSYSLYSRFMLSSQLEYLRNVYKELTTDSELSNTLRKLFQDPRSLPAGKTNFGYIKGSMEGLACEERRGFPFSAETTFVQSRNLDDRRIVKNFPGTEAPRCIEGKRCMYSN